MGEEVKKARGRPPMPKYEINYVITEMYEYIKTHELPIFKEVCYLHNWDSDYLYELRRNSEELSRTIKMLTDKKEVELEQGGLTGKYNKTMAVFSLKQLGWRDKIEIENPATKDDKIKVEVALPTEEDIARVGKLRERLFKDDN